MDPIITPAVPPSPTLADAKTSPSKQEALAASPEWYVLRDLKRPNAKERAWQTLGAMGFEVFTPMRWESVAKGGHKMREQRPVIPDMVFVKSTREALDKVVATTPTLQYRFVRGGRALPMTIRRAEMEAFMQVAGCGEDVTFYRPGDITPAMLKRRIRIVGGPFDGVEGRLLTMRGSAKRRLVVDIPDLLVASVEVLPDYIQLLD